MTDKRKLDENVGSVHPAACSFLFYKIGKLNIWGPYYSLLRDMCMFSHIQKDGLTCVAIPSFKRM